MSVPRRDWHHHWHIAINQHSDARCKEGKAWPSFMYEAKSMATEVPRMALLFKQERERTLPETHRQCSHQEPAPVKDNHISCCLGVKCRECPHLLALNEIKGAGADEIDEAKAWTCAAHIVSSGGDRVNEGYLLRVDDRMFWDNVYASLAAGDET